ncbi:putative formate dehydrogenase family accessory protein FdhD [Paratrimastix pyriformis]|uniref:Formate dehydrogenase family accessory protein FdhD n=1 Tax=Paratrimastix pyriformis TaxID=342808 RepID=A0ABQ8USL8_9EUKA|nr:putative formate dehydrogenase family accessory protein FdhD [Paratrimastix pyriformis]
MDDCPPTPVPTPETQNRESISQTILTVGARRFIHVFNHEGRMVECTEEDVTDRVIAEQAVLLDVVDVDRECPPDSLSYNPADVVKSYVLMCSPAKIPELCAGFALTEGLITSADLRSVEVLPIPASVTLGGIMPVPSPHAVLYRIRKEAPAAPLSRERVYTSGKLVPPVEATPSPALTPCPVTATIPQSALHLLQATLNAHQYIFKETGGAHAVALFRYRPPVAGGPATVGFLCHFEDVGRHNALEKCVGHLLLQGSLDPPATDTSRACPLFAACSGRVSSEMLVLCARAGIALLCSPAAPTSLAIRLAERLGITLCCFVRERELREGRGREQQATVFAVPQRVCSDGPQTAVAPRRRTPTPPKGKGRRM